MQNYSRDFACFGMHSDQFNTKLAYVGTHDTQYAWPSVLANFRKEDKSQLGAEGDAVIIGLTLMQNYSHDCACFWMHSDQFDTY